MKLPSACLAVVLLACAFPAFGAPATVDLDSSIQTLADDIVSGIADVQSGTLIAAVYPFVETYSGNGADGKKPAGLESKETVLAKAIQGQLTAALGDRRRIRLLDRDFEAVLKEQKIQDSGKFDRSTVVAYGAFVGAQGVVTGEILNLISKVQVTIRIIEVKTSETITSASVTIPGRAIDCELLEDCGNRRDSTKKHGETPAVQTKTVAGLEISLESCWGVGDTIFCKMMASHRTQGAIKLWLQRTETTATFPDGQVATATRAVLGTSESRSGNSPFYAVYSLSTATPTSLSLEFGDLPELPAEIVNLHLEFNGYLFEFRKIPIE